MGDSSSGDSGGKNVFCLWQEDVEKCTKGKKEWLYECSSSVCSVEESGLVGPKPSSEPSSLILTSKTDFVRLGVGVGLEGGILHWDMQHLCWKNTTPQKHVYCRVGFTLTEISCFVVGVLENSRAKTGPQLSFKCASTGQKGVRYTKKMDWFKSNRCVTASVGLTSKQTIMLDANSPSLEFAFKTAMDADAGNTIMQHLQNDCVVAV